jgi:tetratricopeptide (TPR) repeat protein
MYEEANRIEEAEKYKRQALELDPDDPQVLEGLAWHLIEYDINLEEGMALIERSVKLDPETYNIVDTWGWGLYKSGRYEEALEALHKAQDLRSLYDPLLLGQIQAVEMAIASSSK